jgi:hypothetical protein
MATLKRDGPQADSSYRSETLGYRSAKMRAKRQGDSAKDPKTDQN